jgi:hypothetical protein
MPQDPLMRELEELEVVADRLERENDRLKVALDETRTLAEHYHTHALSLIEAYRSAGTTADWNLADTIDALEELNKDARTLLPSLAKERSNKHE